MPLKFPKLLLSALLFSSLSTVITVPAKASTGQITVQEDGANRVNISGRQRMLSQRMALAACFVSIGTKPEAHLEMLQLAKSEFSNALFGLRFGNAELRLLRPNNASVEHAFSGVSSIWPSFSEAVDAFLADPAAEDALNHIMETNTTLLTRSHDAVLNMVDIYGGDSISPELANTINVAGRQRMLSQKLGKGVCNTLRDPENSSLREEFVAALDLFSESHVSLLNGDEAQSIIDPQLPELRLQLILVDEAWRTIEPDLELAAAGVPLDQSQIERIGVNIETILVEMNKAVGIYASIRESGS